MVLKIQSILFFSSSSLPPLLSSSIILSPLPLLLARIVVTSFQARIRHKERRKRFPQIARMTDIDIDISRRNKKPRPLLESEREKLEEFIDAIHYSAR